jgi:hypothetical protein
LCGPQRAQPVILDPLDAFAKSHGRDPVVA